MNNDHHLDIVVTNSQTDSIVILFGYGNGTFSTGAIYSTGVGSVPSTVIVSDLNNDDISDIAVTNSGTNNIMIMYGDGDGGFVNETMIPLGYGYNPYTIGACDVNNDGWMDIVLGCYGTDHIETLIKMCE